MAYFFGPLCRWGTGVHASHFAILSAAMTVSYSFHCSNSPAMTLPRWTYAFNLLSLNSSKTEFLLTRLKRQLSEIHNSSTSIDTILNLLASSQPWLHIWQTSFLFWSDISALSKSCYHHIRALRCIRPYLNLHTAKTVATSIKHSKIDYWNSLYYGLPKFQINRLQHIQNALARTNCPGSKIPTHHSYSEISSLA